MEDKPPGLYRSRKHPDARRLATKGPDMWSLITSIVNWGGTRFIRSSWTLAAIATLSVLSRAIGASLARSEQRRRLRELADDNDQHLLRDIGMTRREAYREAAKWFCRR